uniref:DUF7041 domain-containing protein n=1 Tax=Glossina palpalis gambiensis TaxID=67801 RepID=A0A1B0BA29_9MUSC
MFSQTATVLVQLSEDFVQGETRFASKGITQGTIKYGYVLIALLQEIITSIADLIRDPPVANKYQEFKRILIKSKSSKLDKVLRDTYIDYCKPSEFYWSSLFHGRRFTLDKQNELNSLIKSGAEVAVLPLSKFPKYKKLSHITLTAANVPTINAYRKKLLNIDLNLRHDFLFVVLIADILRPRADFGSKYSLLFVL